MKDQDFNKTLLGIVLIALIIIFVVITFVNKGSNDLGYKVVYVDSLDMVK